MVEFVTWNVHRKATTLDLLLHHYADPSVTHDVILGIQEPPPSLSHGSVAAASRLRLRLVTPVDSKVAIIVSAGIVLVGGPAWTHARAAGVRLCSADWANLDVVVLHACSRQDSSGVGTRAVDALGLRAEVDSRVGGRPCVVLGDFNANPFDPEIAGKHAFFAIRDRNELRPRTYKDRIIVPYFNPCWHLLPEHDPHPDPRRPGGTHFYGQAIETIRWQCYDQIIVSADFAGLVGKPTVLSELSGTRLVVPKSARPRRDEVSDHLPVRIMFAPEGVPVCRTG